MEAEKTEEFNKQITKEVEKVKERAAKLEIEFEQAANKIEAVDDRIGRVEEKLIEDTGIVEDKVRKAEEKLKIGIDNRGGKIKGILNTSYAQGSSVSVGRSGILVDSKEGSLPEFHGRLKQDPEHVLILQFHH